MITEGFRVVLLAVCLAVAASSFSDNAELPICERSSGYLVMRDLYHCTTDNAESLPSVKAIVAKQDFTMANIVRVAQDYCTVAVPNGLSCFQDKIRECNTTFQAKVSQLAERGVGLLCQPGGAGLNPGISAVLDGIDDEEFRLHMNGIHDCPGTTMSIRRCHRQMSRLGEPTRLSLDELAALSQRAASNYATCSFRAHKMVKDTCPNWRSAFLFNMEFLLERVLLGVEMPEELARELEM